MNNNKVNYYKTFEDEFVITKNQDYKLTDNYKWINNNIFYKACSNIFYYIAKLIGFIYCKFFLHVKIENKEILKEYKNQGYFIYGNHTQIIGDVFIPALISKKRIYTIASSSNLGIPAIGKILPMIGILPIPKQVVKTKELIYAVNTRIEQKNIVVVYPEAHVWPYYTKIRPYKNTSFEFPVDNNSISFSITTTYYKRKHGKKPGIKVYIDGPFKIDNNLNKKQNKEKIRNEIYNCMVNRSKESNYEFIKYEGDC